MLRYASLLLLAVSLHAADFPTFMTGHWRTTMPNGTVVEEHWTSPDGGLMLGMGRTVPMNGKTEFEFLRIAVRDGKLAYLAMPFARAETPFPMTSLTANKVVFENPAHDYPQRISYWRDGEKLCARVEGKDGAHAEEWCWTKL
ncbi:MAG TPA: DUF6265 family protein [Thermoanaerobaculia bacterium]|nr:DUF6265 family protein [Thermoanaerobaculia bacterium]